MEISKTRAAAYVGAGAAVGGGLAALRASGSVKAIAAGVVTGVAAGLIHGAVENSTGKPELGWATSIGTGALAGAVLLHGMAPAGLSPIARAGVGGAIGATAGLLAPVVAGMVLAQVKPDA